ncbi:hypothetical protein YC2023_117283 [Brassica napus]
MKETQVKKEVRAERNPGVARKISSLIKNVLKVLASRAVSGIHSSNHLNFELAESQLDNKTKMPKIALSA